MNPQKLRRHTWKQSPVHCTLRLLPERKFLNPIEEPPIQIPVLVKRNTLRCVEMYRCSDRYICNREFVASQPLRLGELVIEEASKLIPFRRLCIDVGLNGLLLQQWPDNIFEEIDVAAWKPDRSFPEQPAVDSRSSLWVFWIFVVHVVHISGVLQDCVRLEDGQVTINRGGDCAHWVDFQVLRSFVVASEVVDMVEVIFRAKEVETCQNLSAVYSTRVEIDFQHCDDLAGL